MRKLDDKDLANKDKKPAKEFILDSLRKRHNYDLPLNLLQNDQDTVTQERDEEPIIKITGDEDNILIAISGGDILEENPDLKELLLKSRNLNELRMKIKSQNMIGV